MQFCPKCGRYVEKEARRCGHCGFVFIEEEKQNDEKAPRDVRSKKAIRFRWVFGFFIVLIPAIIFFSAAEFYSAGHQVSSLKKAIERTSDEDAAKLLIADSDKFKINKQTVHPLTTYIAEDPKAKKKLFAALKKQAADWVSGKHPESQNGIMNLRFTGKKWGIFDSYRLVVRTQRTPLKNESGLTYTGITLDGLPLKKDSGYITTIPGKHIVKGRSKSPATGPMYMVMPVVIDSNKIPIDFSKMPAFDEKLQKTFLEKIEQFNKQYLQAAMQNARIFRDPDKPVYGSSIDVSAPGTSFDVSALSQFEYVPEEWQGVRYLETRIDPDSAIIYGDKRMKGFYVTINGNLIYRMIGNAHTSGRYSVRYKYVLIRMSDQPVWRVYADTPFANGDYYSETDRTKELVGGNVAIIRDRSKTVISGYSADRISNGFVTWKLTDFLGALDDARRNQRPIKKDMYVIPGSAVFKQVEDRIDELTKQHFDLSLSSCRIQEWHLDYGKLVVTAQEVYDAYPDRDGEQVKRITLENRYTLKEGRNINGEKDWRFADVRELERLSKTEVVRDASDQ